MKRNLSKILYAQKIKIFSTIFVVFISVSGLFATQSLIRVAAKVDKSVITIGDRIIYTLTIQHAKNLHIEQPGPGANLGQFEIKDYKIYDPVEEDGNISQKFEYKISVFDTGRFVIPPFPVAFAESDTSKNYQLIKSESVEIFVKSVLTAEDSGIRDIKPPLLIPINYRRWFLIGGAALLVLLTICLVIYIIRQRKKGVPLFRKEVIRPAHEIAFEELEELKSHWREMFENGEYKALFTRLSEILRRYLENRFFIQALEQTTFEIRESMQDVNIEKNFLQKAIIILEIADMVKFAKYIPQEPETSETLGVLKEFIEETKLVFEAAENKVEVVEEVNEVAEEVIVSSDNKL